MMRKFTKASTMNAVFGNEETIILRGTINRRYLIGDIENVFGLLQTL